ncbi:alanine:cation symporter family protein [Flammeovirga yaeyamensis]|uniref:Alanine:cation symporter family protein n=1 Tax=Flammeovirga yaeyamensis TaxID=367791 RepID=A0AAX1NCY8_9BACT|nr:MULTISPECIES: alanine/glycine:cation symporter family protein [Flammeovirga]ANQ48991.1 alanine:cation symporter family protein [Flammeovirga sp. MY04]MBB3699075.1 AGCS family alanine or glycine:cation symporter [Flammeovirga yaeyamensis]NMF36509.1 alanine:cation symporter family protein [Flammeovirga yaeyamensis]QWG03533.1 alanine:cation symporter family protein [Flammeovirga yaeyamensis]
MQQLNEILSLIDSYIGGSNWFVALLLLTGLFFTIYLKFPQIRFFKHALDVVRGKFDESDDEGDTSHFQALATALSGTVGTGNIAGVALAIHLGGPAALFWMIVTAFFGMTTKFVEVSLSHKYREKTADGTMAGGPMYFMKNKLNMKWLAVIFAIATVLSSFGTGNLPQVNSIASSIHATFGIETYITGAILSVLLAFVILGGISRIAAVTEKLVPLMAVVYFIGCIAVIFYNIENIPDSISRIMSDIFSGTSATGGFLGASLAYAFNRGVNRGLFSNEAGQGSAPIAHASAKTKEPVSEGMVAILEPFIDTILICSLTGLALLSSNVWREKLDNKFQQTDLVVLSQQYDDNKSNPNNDRLLLAKHVSGEEKLPLFNGSLEVVNGKIMNSVSLIHARSLAENVMISYDGEKFSGKLEVVDGKINWLDKLVINGKSLIHSSPLTSEAFKRSYFGEKGKFIVSIGLLLFAFSTAISWSYYGDRAMTFLLGPKSVIYYRGVYVVAFFVGSFADTTIIWTLSGITIALMTIPNLIGILILSKDMKSSLSEYKDHMKSKFGADI